MNENDHILRALKTVQDHKVVANDRYGVRGGQGRSAEETVDTAGLLVLLCVILGVIGSVVNGALGLIGWLRDSA